jgi:hypothetical protein
MAGVQKSDRRRALCLHESVSFNPKDLPLNHPNLHLPYQAANDDDRGGWNPHVMILE